jgi:hypothetical protein
MTPLREDREFCSPVSMGANVERKEKAGIAMVEEELTLWCCTGNDWQLITTHP